MSWRNARDEPSCAESRQPFCRGHHAQAIADLEERIRTGRINQKELIRELETLRAKFQSTFGKYLNEMVVGQQGNTTGNTSETIMGNSPEARRARMAARLQKKLREKGRK